jgi:hypothetical protein
VRKLIWIAALAGVVLMLGLLSILGIEMGIASAQGPTPTPPSGFFGWGSMMGWGMGGFGPDSEWHTQMQSAVAKALGMTLDELNMQLRSGKTIAQIAQSKDISLTKLHDDVQAAHKALLQQAVKDGKLTQAQADWMTQRMDAMDQWFDANGGACPGWTGAAAFGPGGMMHGGMMGNWRGPGAMMGRFRGPGGMMPGYGPWGGQVSPTATPTAK